MCTETLSTEQEKEFLCRVANNFITAEDTDMVLRLTGEFFHKLFPDILIFTAKVNESSNECQFLSTHIPPRLQQIQENNFLKPPQRITIHSLNALKTLFTGQVQKIDDQWIKALSASHDDLVRFRQWLSEQNFPITYGIGLWANNLLNGFILLFCQDEMKQRQGSPVSSIILLASSTLKRIHNESRLRTYFSMFQHMTDGALIRASDGRFIEANPAALDILGISMDELLNNTHPKLLLFDENHQPLPPGKCPSDITLETGQPVFRTPIGIFNHAKNQVVWCLFSALPIFENNRPTPDQVFILLTDITENKAREESLRQSELKFRTLISRMHQALFLLDQEGRFVTVNEAATRLTGYTQEELLRLSISDIDRTLIQNGEQPLWQHLLNNQSTSFITTHTRKDGSAYLAEVSFSGIQLNDQNYVLVLVRDVTEQVRLENELKNSEASARTLINAIPDMFFRFYAQGNILDYKEEHPDLFIRNHKLHGRHLSEVLPDDLYQLTMEKLHQTLSSGNIQQFEYRLNVPDSGLQYFEARMLPLNSTEVIAIVRNITERKIHENQVLESESTLRAIMDSVEYGIILTDIEGNISNHNEFFLRFLQSEGLSLTGKNLRECFPPEISEMLLESIRKSSVTGHSMMFESMVNYTVLEWTINPVRNPDGTSGRVSVFFRDITKRKQDEEKLRRSEQELKELNAAKDKFFSIIAHDLKSPFNAIIGISELLKEQVQEKDLQGIEEMLEILSKASRQAYELLSNLLDWSRSQTGRLIPEPSYFELTSALQQVIGQLKPAADQKSITIQTQLPHFAPVFADKGMILTVFRNLLSNAIKFTHPGGKIVISLVSKPNEFVISVKDTGIGIHPANLKKLFRIDSTFIIEGTHKERGTGLGLLLCKEFVEKHKGKIFVESEVGKGSTFTFTIPKTFETYK